MIDANCLPLLCDPDTHAPLQLGDGVLVNTESGRRYPIREGIPIFSESVSGKNRKSQAWYDLWAVPYDLSEPVYKRLFPKWDFRPDIIRELEVGPGARVLEVAVGTGANLRYIGADAEIFGLDVSLGMLRRCARNVQKWRRKAYLFQGEAERLPFRDEVFGTVFSLGAINYVRDRAREPPVTASGLG